MIIIYGNGFGPTIPPTANGQLQTTAALLALYPVIQVGGATASIGWGGLSATGLYQFNVTLPTSLQNGDASVTAVTAGGISSPATGLITIHN